MVELLLQLVVGPALIGASTLAGRRWGAHAAGSLSAFPAVVGPVLLVCALDHGGAFATRTANGILLGLVALSGFVLAYGWSASLGAGWLASLFVGWVVAGAIASLVARVEVDSLAAVAVASVSLVVAHRSLPDVRSVFAEPLARWWDAPLRMAVTAALVVTVTALAAALGPGVGGVVAALPVLASILATFTHQQLGAPAVVHLLRGMLEGMLGFALFCVIVAELIPRAGIAAAFSAAVVAALAAQATVTRQGGLVAQREA